MYTFYVVDRSIIRAYCQNFRRGFLVMECMAVVRVAAVLLLVVVGGNSDCDGDLLNRHLVHHASGRVRRRRDDLFAGVLGALGGGRSDGWGSSLGSIGSGDCGGDGGRRLDVVDGDAAAVGICYLAAGGRVAGDWRGSDAGDLGDNGLACVAVLERLGVAGTVLDWDVAAETLSWAGAVVGLENLGHVVDLALTLLELSLELAGKVLAVFGSAGGVGAVIDSGLKSVDVPAVHEITVVTVSSWVTVGPSELTSLVLESIRVPDGLVEERRQTGLEALGALASVNQTWVSNMALVVRRLGILAVPARWEEDLSTNTVRAVGVQVCLVRHLMAVTGAFGSLAIVQAVEAKRLLSESELGLVLGAPGRCWSIWPWAGEVTKTRVTRKHLETLGESLKVVAQEQVVCEHTANLRDNLDSAIFMDEM